MRLLVALAAVCAVTTVVSACSGSSNGQTKDGGSAANQKLADNATFTFAADSDPGNLDPQMSAAGSVLQMALFGYDSLVHVDAKGKIVSGLATSWTVNGNTVQLTLHKGITCSDGSSFTAKDAAANLNWVADPKNKSPFLGVFVPGGTKATADETAGTVTMTAPQVGPFVLNGLANLPIVCAKGLADRTLLAHGMDGTGPYKLTDVAAGDHYTFVKRDGYTWGPDGASTSAKGLPAKIVVKVVPNATTAANLLLSGGLNGASVLGPDAQRLEKAKLFAAKTTLLVGEMWFNEAKGRPGADKAVRQALTQALDLDQVQKVLTSGTGTAATTFATAAPVACPGNSVADALPKHDLAQAKQLLDQDGWTVGSDGVRSKNGKQLALTLLYDTGLGTGVTAAAELATQTWKQLGVKITAKPQANTAVTNTLFGTGDWDISWEALNVSSPDQLVPFLSGPVPPNGTNFGHIDNAAYSAGVAAAAKLPGAQGCADWLKAESNLVSDADVVPFANKVVEVFGKGARFDFVGELIPTSIRMLAD